MKITTLQTKEFVDRINRGQLDQALMLANEVSRQDPQNPLGYTMLGDALKQKGEFEKAAVFYRYSLQIKPDQPGLYITLGEAYALIGEQDKALENYSKALHMAPGDSKILQKTGNFLIMSGYHDEAREVLEQALALGNQKAINSLLDLLIYQGDKNKIKEFVEKNKTAIRKYKGDFELARAEFSLGNHQAAINILESMETNHRNTVWKRAYYNLMAAAYEKLNKFDKAFHFYHLQNSLSNIKYDPKQMEKDVYNVIDNVKHMDRLHPNASDQLKTPFSPLFIIGLPRSGTSLLEQVLNTSTHVVTGGELLFIEAAYKQYVHENKDLVEIAEWYREKIAFITKNQRIPKSAPRWVTDKLPSNFMYLGFIKNLLPDSRFLYCLRNPMDNGLSIYKQNFLDTHGYAFEQKNIAHFIALEREVMKYWKSHYNKDIYTVKYENLVTNFDLETQKIFDHCDLHWNDQVKNFHQNPYFTNTASFDQVRRPVYSSSVGLHQQYAQYMSPLKDTLSDLAVF